MKKLFALALSSLSLAAACGEEVHGQEACDAVSATATPLTAGTSSAAAAAVTASATPYEITLPAGAAGYLKLSNAADTAYLVAFKSAGVLAGITQNGTAITYGAPEALDACSSDIPAHHDLDLEVVGDYVIRVGPVAGDKAWMYLDVDAAHEHE